MNMEKTHTHTVSRVAGALVASAALMPVASQAQEMSMRDIAKIEIERRKALVAGIDGQVEEAREAYTNQDYQKSVNLYTGALAVLPQGRVAEPRRKFLTQSLAQASIELSKTMVRQGDVSGAQETLGSVLKFDPTNEKAEKELDKTYDPIRINPSTTKEYAADVDKVRIHLYKGEGFYNQGLLDEAHAEFDKVVRIDPYNQAARRWQSKVHAARSAYFQSSYDETRARLLSQVDQAWEIVPTPVAPKDTRFDTTDGIKEDVGVLINQRKLDSIIIPRIDIENSTLDAAIAQLSGQARDGDSETDINKKGLSFVIRRQRQSGGPEGEGIEGEEIRIASLSLQNVPLGEALRQICLQCEPRMRVKVEKYVVAIVPATDIGVSETFPRNFNVPPDFIERLGAGGGGGESNNEGDGIFGSEEGGGSSEELSSLKETFESMGVKFPGNSNVKFIPATSTLAVTNTAVGLDKIDKIINTIIVNVPKQISITTKFVEITQQDNDELGFDWVVSPFGLTANSLFLGGGNVGNGSARSATNFGQVPNGNVGGIGQTGNVFNTLTGGLRSGDTAVTRDSINFFLNNPTRTAQTASVAPGILSVTGLFTDGQVQMVMRGLAQKKGTDVMNAPTILARPGEQARIEVVRQFIYPTEYDPPEIPDNINGGGNNNNIPGTGGNVQVIPITPATPTAFEERPTGVILEITPKVGEGPNKRTISLDLEPEIVEFEGFINYGSPIQAIATDALGNPVQITVTENRIEMPVFSRRSVKTGLTIFDGHTVAVGGLMSEEVQKVEDKVPVLGDLPILGRLFQSSAENRIKSNLVIFVTANIIDATGRKLYSEATELGGAGAASTGFVTPGVSSSSSLLPSM